MAESIETLHERIAHIFRHLLFQGNNDIMTGIGSRACQLPIPVIIWLLPNVGATAAAAGAGARASADARATVERLATQPRAVAFVTWWFVTWSGNKRNKRRYTN